MKKLRVDTTSETFNAEVPDSTTKTVIKNQIENNDWIDVTDSNGVTTMVRTSSITNIRLA